MATLVRIERCVSVKCFLVKMGFLLSAEAGHNLFPLGHKLRLW